LPLEEILFFIVVPYCCMFIYECIRCYFPAIKNKAAADVFLKCLGAVLLITGGIFYQKQYSCCTFIFTGLFIFIIYGCRKYFTTFDAASFLTAYAVCLIPFLIVNGFLTALPVITYNHNQNFNTRIYTIPFEDAFYGMLLILMNVVIYEKLKGKQVS
jgi:lycopene cyclase domain-containing protein